jgi:hypothetical protein
MRTTKINLKGADSAHYEEQKTKETRIFRFSDGIERSITYSKRIWAIYDDLTLTQNIPANILLQNAFEHAQDFQGQFSDITFEEEIRRALKGLLLAFQDDDNEQSNPRSNDHDFYYDLKNWQRS